MRVSDSLFEILNENAKTAINEIKNREKLDDGYPRIHFQSLVGKRS